MALMVLSLANTKSRTEGKIHNLCEYLENLDEKDQGFINSMLNYFIPWCMVWNKSISTPVRPVVFDASHIWWVQPE